ncbi:Acyl-[acyl-carrier-protein]--UDP-N-acetylglucosamine O-acyltransferase [Rhodoplanes serenus]|uniref:Acyl-[acyl-carrier-protein]--UDP-N-acetylglucosam ine O-acyltransferase n=1 Tax=Rhodoplanes serenus TaxID=200615 RepID=A0A447D2J4_9BRAD|nr:acyl-ACP--UDP-N-acetylglucosamine O-acyltransferase [Rhodoplanes serenus]VCU11739.1 Acyl-[acyl-carrier-protein]--UDP-N-acetylglucosamine O-acyltransferase [Rhodoplanes serenus]
MAVSIDPTARVADGARLADGAEIGPFCTVGPHVEIGAGTRLISHVNVTGHTVLGERNTVYPFASLGTPPQSVKYGGGPTRLVVGSDNDIREGVTMNTGTEGDHGITRVGSGCFFMVGSHVGHDCTVGDHVTFANNAVLGGHVQVGNNVVFGGQAAVRQFVRIGDGAMITGLSGVRADVIPFGLVHGHFAEVVGLNVVGMRRRGLSKADIHKVHRGFEALFFGPGTFRERLEAVAAELGDDPLIGQIIAFIRGGSRPLTMGAKRGAQRAEP